MEDVVGTTRCHLCKGNGVVVREYAVIELASADGGSGLVHVTCPRCGGDGNLPGLQAPS